MAEPKILTVTEVTELIKEAIEPKFTNVWVTGEVSNCKYYTSSGHTYLSIKDENSQLNALIFSFVGKNLKFRLEDGLKVIVSGKISLYSKRGEYRILISYIEPAGKGALQLAFEQLKEKLSKEGLFEQSRKKQIPFLPQKIGIITSRDGAALHDILTILERRFANVEILIHPVKVQGEDAKTEIAAAIEYLNANCPELDVLLIGRGGGSLEDLWAFNEEIVARAIAASKIPTISCVGHEIDFTISDFVADLRAPTPSAAAEIVVKSKQEFVQQLDGFSKRFKNCLIYMVQNMSGRLNSIRSSKVFTQPAAMVEQKMQEIGDLNLQIMNSMKHFVELKLRDFQLLNEKLGILSPLNILSRGYAIAYKLPEKTIIKNADEIKAEDSVLIKVGTGEFETKVIDKNPE